MKDLPVSSIEIGTHAHDDVYAHSTLSSKTRSNISVVTAPSNIYIF